MCLSLNSRFSCASLLTGYIPMLCRESTSRHSKIQKPLGDLMAYQGNAAQLCLILVSGLPFNSQSLELHTDSLQTHIANTNPLPEAK